ncbi:MAG: 3-phosphoshikimate 1-carboxyvinyltransferase [Planctomycetes bacterium]|nr:3-phosphoshikimate 1-carboxyvinyltransferase [Planctomycetota bacterium]
MTARVVSPARGPLVGDVRPPGDKSISHRALLLGAVAEGTTVARGLLDAADVRSTAACLRALGVDVRWTGDEAVVTGGDLRAPEDRLDCGNSGTTMRLLTGVLAGRPLEATLVGDASLMRRPMLRVADPLRRMGATVDLAPGDTAPVHIRGGALTGIDFEAPLASAQVKSAVLLAGLSARGTTRVREPSRSRDHTERLLRAMDVTLDEADGWLVLPGGQRPRARAIDVPADPSSAAFLLAAGLLVPGSRARARGVTVNPTRAGLVEVLGAMGAEVVREDEADDVEPTATLGVTPPAGGLVAAMLGGDLVVRAIDEVPVLAVLAAFARGTTAIRDAAELRHKESDRLAFVARGLRALGVDVTEHPDGLDVVGDPARVLRGGVTLETRGDHRLAMAFGVAALRADGPVTLDDGECVAVSYPGFWQDLATLQGG